MNYFKIVLCTAMKVL